MDGRTNMILEAVVLVDENDRELGTMEKLEAHRQGVLHRAFSIFLFDDAGRLLLQQRAATKYHSASLWTNTCCSHPRPGESLEMAADRRLREEMGLATELDHRFSFIYKARVDMDLWEHELDHVLFGRCNEKPAPDPGEVQAWKFMAIEELGLDMEQHPDHYTAWLHRCWPMLLEELRLKRA